jgi:hypothetical protein
MALGTATNYCHKERLAPSPTGKSAPSMQPKEGAMPKYRNPDQLPSFRGDEQAA